QPRLSAVSTIPQLPSVLVRTIVLAAVGLLVAAGCHKESSVAAASATLSREQAAAHFAKQEIGLARASMQPLVAGANAAYEDLIRAASIEIADDKGALARSFLERAAK